MIVKFVKNQSICCVILNSGQKKVEAKASTFVK